MFLLLKIGESGEETFPMALTFFLIRSLISLLIIFTYILRIARPKSLARHLALKLSFGLVLSIIPYPIPFPFILFSVQIGICEHTNGSWPS